MARQLVETPAGQHLIIDTVAKTRSDFLSESPWTFGATGAVGVAPTTAAFSIASVAMYAMSPFDLVCFPAGTSPAIDPFYKVLR